MTVSAVAGLAVSALAGPALAHVEVSADQTRAGATDVTLTFHGEAENPRAGIKSERVVLPKGIAPGDVSPVKVPAGWTFAPGADGFTVGGKALKIGADAIWKVKIAKLPDGQTRLSFKTLETYGNGDVSRWIEIQEPGQDEPDNPAPLLTLKPGVASSAPAAPSAEPASASPVAVPSAAATTPQAQAPAAGRSTWWIWAVIVALVVVAGVLVLVRRRRSPDAD